MNVLEHAEALLGLGWSVVPVEYKGKRPLVRWKEFQVRKPTLREWDQWGRQFRPMNIGLLTGQISGLVAFDCDGPGAEKALLNATGGWPMTLAYKTRQGTRFLFQSQDPVKSWKIKAPDGSNLECLAEGGHAVLPPSIHPTGTQYRWLDHWGPDDCAPDPLPAHLAVPPKGARPVSSAVLSPEPIGSGERNSTLVRIGGHFIRACLTPDEVFRCLCIVNERCDPPLDESEVDKIARSLERYRK